MGVVGRPLLPDSVLRRGLAARARGATLREAAAVAGVSIPTLLRGLRDDSVTVRTDRRARAGALTLEEREEYEPGFVQRPEDASWIAGR